MTQNESRFGDGFRNWQLEDDLRRGKFGAVLKLLGEASSWEQPPKNK
jgi:hypothetical protein